MSDAERRIPVTILTGFLGAGKTTLLSAILSDPRFADSAVIVNEFGEIALDHALIDTADEDLVETTAGCLCCTVQGDVRRSVVSLIERAQRGEIRSFSRLIVETTGLADPAPILHTFMNDDEMRARVALNGVVTLVDAVNGDSTLDRFQEARRQVACADVVCLTKSDLAADPASLRDVAKLTERLRRLNAGARIVDIRQEPPTPESLFSLAAYDPSGKPPEVLDWLRYEESARHAHHKHGPDHEDGHVHGHSHGHGHGQEGRHRHDHDRNRHGDDIEAHCIAFDAPLHATGFWFGLEMLQAYHGERLLRLKGLVALDDAPDQPVLLHGVQHVLSPPSRLEAWPSDDHRTRIVVIAKGVPAHEIRGVFEMFKSGETASA